MNASAAPVDVAVAVAVAVAGAGAVVVVGEGRGIKVGHWQANEGHLGQRSSSPAARPG